MQTLLPASSCRCRTRLVKALFASLALTPIFAFPSAQAQSATWTQTSDATTTWENGANWSTGSAPGSTSPTSTTDTDIATFLSSTGTTTATVITLPSTLNLGGIVFNGNSAYTLTSGTLVLSNNAVVSADQTIDNTDPTFDSAIVLEGNASFIDNSTGGGNSFIFNSTITEAPGVTGTITFGGADANSDIASLSLLADSSGGVTSLNKTGAGILLISGVNTYTGATTVYGGSVSLTGTDGSFADTGSVTIEGGGELSSGATSGSPNRLNTAATLTLGGAYSTLDGSSLNGTYLLNYSTTAKGGAGSQSLPSLTIAGGTSDLITTGNLGTGAGDNGTLAAVPTATFTASNPYVRNTDSFVDFDTSITSGTLTGVLTVIFNNAPTGSGNVGGGLLLGAYTNGNSFILAQAGTLTAPTYTTAASGSGSSYTSTTNLDVTGSTTLTGAISVNSLLISAASTSTLTLTGANSVASPGILVSIGNSPGSALNTATTGTVTIAGGSITSAATTGELLVYVDGGNVTISSNIVDNSGTSLSVGGGGGSAPSADSGTVTLLGANTYTGGTSIASGATLILGNGTTGSLVSTGGITVNYGSTFDLNLANGTSYGGNIANDGTINFNNTAGDTQTYSGAISNGASTVGTVVQNGTGTTILTAANTYTGTTTITKGVLQLGNGGTTGALSSSSTIVDTGTLAIDRSNAVTQGTDFSSAAITGSGALTQIGSGTTTLNAANTYAGKTTVDAGTLVVGQSTVSTGTITSGAIGTGALSMANGSALDDNGTAITLANSVSTTGTVTFGSTGSGSLTFDGTGLTTHATFALGGATTLDVNNTTTIKDVVSGGYALTQSGTGTLVLAGANTYTGTTTINSGVISITGSTVSTGTVVIQSGGTLAGTGSTGHVTLASGGAINLADGVIGTLTIGSLTTTGGGALTFEIGTGGTTQIDNINDTGVLTASGSTTINVANLGGVGQTLTTGTYTILTYTGATTLGTFTLSTSSLDGKNLSLTQSGDNLEIVVTNSVTTTSTTYTLSTTAGSTLLHQNGTTTLTTVVTNTGTGTADTLNYSGLGATATNGSVTGSYTSGGPLANGSVGTGTNTQAYTATTVGSDTISATGSGTNATLGGSATLSGSTGTTINVYSGQSVWAGTGASGSWGTLATGFGTNWGANQGSPGLDPNFADTDSATFGTVAGQSAVAVTLDGASPSLNAITFDSSTTSFTLAQGTGTGSITLNGGGSNATVTDTLGTHEISAPINLATSANVDVASGQQLTISGTISGTGGLYNTGSGTTILSGNNGYSGGTTVSSGTLELNNGNSGSATGSGALSVGAGATLAGIGSSSGSSFSITGNGTTAATVLVGHNSASDLNTTGVTSLQATGASSISAANLVFNINSNTAGQGNQLNVGATAITFNSVGSMSTTLTLNVEGTTYIAGETTYVLVAGTGSTIMGDTSTPTLTSGQYAGLETFVNSKGQDQIITGPTSNLQLKFADPTQAGYYAPSYLFIVDNGSVDDIEVEVVPEPGTWALMLGGLAVLIFIQRSRRKDP